MKFVCGDCGVLLERSDVRGHKCPTMGQAYKAVLQEDCMTKPTEEQITKFWEWCGFKYVRVDTIPWHKKPEDYQTNIWYANNHWVYPDGSRNKDCPSIDLNNIFKWAVPKLERNNLYNYIHFGFDKSCPEITTVQLTFQDKLLGVGDSKDPALALFWAIWRVIDG